VGADLDTVSRSLGVTAATLSEWRAALLDAGEAGLASKPISGEERESDRFKARLGVTRLELDANIVERAMRPIALGQKNAPFAGADSGGRHWSILATLIQTAKLNNVDPLALADRRAPAHGVRTNQALRTRPAFAVELEGARRTRANQVWVANHNIGDIAAKVTSKQDFYEFVA
jgi:hypothetical protein